MTEPNDVQSSLDRMKIHMELRGLRPNTVSTFAVHLGKDDATYMISLS
jgi:hypothetical protein